RPAVNSLGGAKISHQHTDLRSENGVLFACHQTSEGITEPSHRLGGLTQRAPRLQSCKNVVSTFFLFALLAGLIAVLVSPQIASEASSHGCLLKGPPSFVKDKTLDYDFVRGLQVPKVQGPLDAILLIRNGNKMSAALTQKGDHIELRSSGPRRTARVIQHSPSQFVYREDYSYGQRVLHTMTFASTSIGDYSTKFDYEVKWKGSLAMVFLGKLGLTSPIGFNIGSIEDLRMALEDAYEDERRDWGDARYH
ncbi:hypothetical protein HII31_01356, partial [Pseudocercospora fuligena]